VDIRITLALSAMAGAVFALNTTSLQSLALLIVPLACCRPRLQALLTLSCFYAVACLPAAWVTQAYSNSLPVTIAVYVSLVVINTALVGIATYQRHLSCSIAVPLALMVLSIPPMSYINPVSVAPLAGWLFEGMGLLGLMGLFVLIGASIAFKRWGAPALLSAIVCLFSINAAFANEVRDSITGISVSRPFDARLHDGVMRQAYRYEERDLIKRSDTRIVVLPESVFGVWDQEVSDIVTDPSRIVYGGARRYLDKQSYINTVVEARTGEVVYEQRNPPSIPGRHVAVAVAGRGKIKETGVAFLLCYDLLNPWIAIDAFNQNADSVVWMSNLSWFRSPYLERRMRSVAHAWGRLFSTVPALAVLRHD